MSDIIDLGAPKRPTRIITLDEPAAEAPATKSKPRSVSSMADFVQKRELVVILSNLTERLNKGVVDASEAVGEAVFDSIAEKSVENFARMEHTLRQEFMAEFERRSFRGRARRLLWWITRRKSAAPALVEESPPQTREEALAELRDLIAGAGPNMSIELPEGTTEEDARAIEQELRAERQAAVDDVTPADPVQ